MDIASQKAQLLMEDSDGAGDSDMSSSTTDGLVADNHSLDDGVYPLPDSASDTSDLHVIGYMATVGNAACKAEELPMERKISSDTGRTVQSLNLAASNVSDAVFSVPSKITQTKKLDSVSPGTLPDRVSLMSCRNEGMKETVTAGVEATSCDVNLATKIDRPPALLGCDNGATNHSKKDVKNEHITPMTEKCSLSTSEVRRELPLAMQNSETSSSHAVNGQRESAVQSLKSQNSVPSDSRDSSEENSEGLKPSHHTLVSGCFV